MGGKTLLGHRRKTNETHPWKHPPHDTIVWEDFCRKHHPNLKYYFATHVISREDVEDLIQEAFMALFRGESVEDPDTYIHGIAKNLLRQHQRTRRKELAGASGQLAPDTEDSGTAGAGSAQDITEVKLQEIINESGAHIPASCLQALSMKLIQCLSAGEIAQKIGCSTQAVYKRLQRARIVVQQAREEHGKTARG
jgi:RNA polymerase sigma factor (sigma-70 family)